MVDALAGYFPKKTGVPPDWKGSAGVQEICSVSECLVSGPEGWVDQWRHNELGFFDTPEIAFSMVVPGNQEFSVFGYRLLLEKFVQGEIRPLTIPSVRPQPLPKTYGSLGFDVVSKSASHFFECSPLSCNLLAGEVPVNRYCLIDSLNSARDLARRFSVEQPEPGEYHVVEVFREAS